MSRPVTERDFRLPEFRDASPRDYEFNEHGELVRKDRWEQALKTAARHLEVDVAQCGVEGVVEAIAKLTQVEKLWFSQGAESDGWGTPPSPSTAMSWPPTDKPVVVRLQDQSILFNASFSFVEGKNRWTWDGHDFTDRVVAWRHLSQE